MSKTYQEYQNRVFFKGTTKRDYVKNKVKESIDDLIFNSQYGFSITVDNKAYNVAILSTRTTQEYEAANVIAHLGFLDKGTVFTWENNDWIVLKKMFRPDQPGFNGIAYKCTDTLKWIDNTGTLNIQPAYVRSGRITNALGVTPDKNEYFDNIILHDTDWNMMAATPLNLNLKTEMRFIIKGQAYRVSNIDNVSIEGVSIMSLVADKLLDSDDVINNVATTSTLRIEPSIKLPIQVSVGNTLTMPIVVYDNGIVVNEECTYSGYDSKVTIADNVITGVTAGDTKIICRLVKNPLVTKTLDITVVATIENNESEISIIGSDYILWNTSETYKLSDNRNASYSFTTKSKATIDATATANSVTFAVGDKHTGVITITAVDEDNNEYTKDIIIKTN